MTFYQKSTRKFEAMLLFTILTALIALPVLILSKGQEPKRIPENKRVKEKFKQLSLADSAELWSMKRDWMYEYTVAKPYSVNDYIKMTNYKYAISKFKLRYKWFNAFSKQEHSIEFDIPKDLFFKSMYEREIIKDFLLYSTTIREFLINDFLLGSGIYLQDKVALLDISEKFLKLPRTSNDSLTETAYNIITFVQSLQYIDLKAHRIKEDSLFCLGIKLFPKVNNEERWESLCFDCKPPFHPERSEDGSKIIHEILTPLEFLKFGKGDCDSRTILAFTLLKNLGYKVATVRIQYYQPGESKWHAMLGIAGVRNFGNNYFEFKGSKYYYVELTKPNWWIGELTPGQKRFGRLRGLDLPEPVVMYGPL